MASALTSLRYVGVAVDTSSLSTFKLHIYNIMYLPILFKTVTFEIRNLIYWTKDTKFKQLLEFLRNYHQ